MRFSNSLYHSWWWRGSRYRAVAGIDPQALAEFQAGIRRRYTDEQILDELRASAERLGRSPTMKEFAADPDAQVHPQTVIEHFGTWNAAKRAAGLDAAALRDPRGARRAAAAARRRSSAGPDGAATSTSAAGTMPSEVALLAHVRLARRRRSARRASTWRWGRSGSSARSRRAPRSRAALGRLPKFGDWQAARRADESMLTEWQVYRMFESRRGAWATFQFLVRERLLEDGAAVGADGSISR